MIINIETMKPITKLPHEKEFKSYKKLLSDTELESICEEINYRIDGNKVNTSSWVPGNDWEDTPFEPLSRICNGNRNASGLLFGLFIFKVFMDKEEAWGIGKYKNGEKIINGMTYFLLKNYSK